MLFPIQQEKYMQHLRAERGRAEHPWTANTLCLVQGPLHPARDVWEGRSPRLFSCVTACASWTDTALEHSSGWTGDRIRPVHNFLCRAKCMVGWSRKHLRKRQPAGAELALLRSVARSCAASVQGDHAKSRDRMTQTKFLGLFLEDFTAGAELCAPLHCYPCINQHGGVCLSSHRWCMS